MAILIYAQLDQSTFWAARLTSEDTGRWQYGRYNEGGGGGNGWCCNWTLPEFYFSNLQNTLNFNCIYLKTFFLGGLAQLCKKASK